MSKIVVGCDLDSTLVDLSVIIDKINRELGYNFRPDDILDWSWKTFPNEYRERGFQLYSDSDFMCYLKPIKGAQEKIIEWKNKGYDVVIITARTHKISAGTYEMVNRLFPLVDETIIVDHNCPKRLHMIEKKLTYWIDDAPHEVLNSLDLGISTYLISNGDTRYNWHVRKLPKINVVESVNQINI